MAPKSVPPHVEPQPSHAAQGLPEIPTVHWGQGCFRRLGLCVGMLTLLAAHSVAAVSHTGTDTRLRCDVVYLPAHSTWTREVVLTHAGQRLRTVAIDGVAVYTFALNGPVVLTSLDNERIQLDLSQPAWRSDFRGLAFGQGLCTLLP